MSVTIKNIKSGAEKSMSPRFAKILVGLGKHEYSTTHIDESPRKAALTARKVAPLRHDGPTLEEFVAAGYKAEHYPPEGYAAKESTAQVDDLLGEGAAPTQSLDDLTLEQLHARAIELGLSLHPQLGVKKTKAAILAAQTK